MVRPDSGLQQLEERMRSAHGQLRRDNVTSGGGFAGVVNMSFGTDGVGYSGQAAIGRYTFAYTGGSRRSRSVRTS
jgi:hypothetical protein